MRPPFLESGTHFGVPRGPWRSPGGSKNLPKQCIWLWLLPMPRNGLNKAQSWLNITEHIQGDMLKAFQPLESATGGCKKHLKNCQFWLKNGIFWRFWGSPVTLFWGPKGPNRPPRRCLTMFNLVQPTFNSFMSARGFYGQEIAFLGQKRPFLTLMGPPGDTIWGPLRPKLTPLSVFDNVQPCST